MDKETILKALESQRKGTFFRIVVDRPAEVLQKKQDEAGEIRKKTAYSLQLASYSARKPVREAVDSGEREGPQTPSWVVETQTLPNGVRFWKHANGQEYLALPVFGDKSKAQVQWRRNGRKISKEKIADFLTAKEKRETPPPADGQASFNAIKLENIARVSGTNQKKRINPPDLKTSRSGTPYDQRPGTVGSVEELASVLRKQEPLAAVIMATDLKRRAGNTADYMDLKDTQWHDDDWCESQND